MYKPNFCAECGARIERPRWRIWTSRRFCSVCDKRFRKARLTLTFVTSLALFSVGFMIGRAGRPAPPPLIIERGQPSVPAAPPQFAPHSSGTEVGKASASSSLEPGYSPSSTANERPTDPNEIVSICGARTQKGTPCSRRVRGTGRCWQHRGKPAMLPPSKLIVQG